jgi:hypothetical protein
MCGDRKMCVGIKKIYVGIIKCVWDNNMCVGIVKHVWEL